MRSGIFYGGVALCNGLIEALKRRYAPHATVVATGGASPLVRAHSKIIDHIKPHLVLEGLYQLSLPNYSLTTAKGKVKRKRK